MGKNISPWGIQCKQQMLAKRMKLKDLSQETGLSVPYLSTIINGRVVAPPATIQRINSILEINT